MKCNRFGPCNRQLRVNVLVNFRTERQLSFVQGGAKKAECVEKEIFCKMLPRKKAAEVNVRPCSKRKCETEN